MIPRLSAGEIADLIEWFRGHRLEREADTARGFALIDEVERSRALLKRIEWSATDSYAEQVLCPECKGNMEIVECGTEDREPVLRGHKPDCELAALIGKL